MIRKNCQSCGRFFWRKRWQDKKYCDLKCFHEWQKKTHRTTYNCQKCGKEVTKCNSWVERGGKYCSPECRQESQRKRVEKQCDYCDEVFEVVYARKETARFCSKKCKGLAKRNRSAVDCDYCGNEFQKHNWKISRSEHDFCSRGCWKSWVAENDSPKRKGNTHKCNNCGNQFYRSKAQIRKSNNLFCCRSCAYEYLTLYPKTAIIRRKIQSTRYYVRKGYWKDSGISPKIVPKSLIKAKRQHLKLKRYIRKQKS